MIELQQVSFGYGGGFAARDWNLTLEDHSLTAVIGENGSGKTTLLRLLAGELRPREGRILLDGRDTASLPKRALARSLSYFPQGRPIPDMTVEEVVSLGRYPHVGARGERTPAERQRILFAMERAGVASFASRPVRELSYGERQRVYLAMQLAQDANHCLFDEPTNFLDAAAAFSMLEQLRALAGEGRCVLCVLHDLSLAMQYAHRILLLHGGRLVADGTPEQIDASGAVEEYLGVALRRVETSNGAVYAVTPGHRV
ncbi:MAG: ABC transporter ATP-binding protein [Clostridia bacterium]|nr:ABC transporter ATP-binding protein [Clostridia bacterium]